MSVPGWLLARPIAHRGLHAPDGPAENTIGAADAAVAAGYGIECDVQLSADGEAMVFHDHDLDRLTSSKGPVRERGVAELAGLAVKGTADRIPTLPIFLDRIGGRVPLVVEVKSRFDGDERLVRRIVDILAGRTEPVAVKSFDPAVVALLRQLLPRVPRGIVGQSSYDSAEMTRLGPERVRAMTELLHWDATRPDFISWRHTDLPGAATFLPRLLAGVPVMTWTIRSPDDAARALRYADGIVFEGFKPV